MLRLPAISGGDFTKCCNFRSPLVVNSRNVCLMLLLGSDQAVIQLSDLVILPNYGG